MGQCVSCRGNQPNPRSHHSGMLPCISNILRSFGFLVATACNRLIRKREEVRPHNRKQNYLSAVNRFESDRTAETIRGQGNTSDLAHHCNRMSIRCLANVRLLAEGKSRVEPALRLHVPQGLITINMDQIGSDGKVKKFPDDLGQASLPADRGRGWRAVVLSGIDILPNNRTQRRWTS